MSISAMTLPLLFLLAACYGTDSGTTDSGDSAGSTEFCDLLDDAGTTLSDGVGGTETAGDLVVRVITGETVDPHDPQFVAYKDYTLENVDMGGVATTGQTTSDGLVGVNNLGPGNWAFRATFSRGSALCEASMNLPIAAASTLYACPSMTCPD